jgi:hypothetical protein
MQYHVTHNGQNLRFSSQEEIYAACLSGKLDPHALYWCKGMPDWKEVETLMEVRKYQVVSDGKPLGTFTEQEILLLLQQSRLRPDDLCWTKGMKEWKPLAEIISHPDLPPLPPSMRAEKESEPWFLSLSNTRLILMGVATMGIFSAYWFFRNWKYLQQRDRLQIMPFWRSVFGVFFLYDLLEKIRTDRLLGQWSKTRFPAGWMTAGWIGFTLLANWMTNMEVIGWIAFGGFVICSFTILFLLPAQQHIVRANSRRGATPVFSPWSTGQWGFLAAGLVLWGFAGVVFVTYTEGGGSGTGFFISREGHIVTNAHVVENASEIRVSYKGQTLDAELITIDDAVDLAILKIEIDEETEALPIAPSHEIKLGATVATVGYPNAMLQGRSPKLSKGEISSLAGIRDDPRFFQISVPLQPGNSGGALFDTNGQVVGVVSSKLNAHLVFFTMGYLPENVNYAVKSRLLFLLIDTIPGLRENLADLQQETQPFEQIVERAMESAVFIMVR